MSLLRNDKITLRAMEPTDIDTIFQWENSPAVWMVSDTVEPYSRAALENYAQCVAGMKNIYDNGQLRLIVALSATGEAIGTVDFLNFRAAHNRAELGVLIAPAHQGKGYGTEALRMACHYAAEVVGLRQVYCYVVEENAPSLAMVHRTGFEEVGILRRWLRHGKHYHNVVVFQKIF